MNFPRHLFRNIYIFVLNYNFRFIEEGGNAAINSRFMMPVDSFCFSFDSFQTKPCIPMKRHNKNIIQTMEFDHGSAEMALIADKDEKYSLRQRQRRPTRSKEDAAEAKQPSGREKKEKKKPKAPPLSKYRRKTANARERTRMREINSAFENLRKCVPPSISNGTPTTTNEKLTKITTLRLAMKYIRTLNDVLTGPGTATDLLLDELFNRTGDTDAIESAADNNNSIAHNFNSTAATEVNNNNNGKARKRSPKKQTATATAAAKRTSKATKPNRTRNAKKPIVETPCLPPKMDSPMDLGLMLESDGESLHLSEPCLSPMGQTIKPFNNTLTITNSGVLELGMFFESDNDSLEFSEPCLSPLAAFDVLSPFGDLLQSGFSEQSSLDMYLT